MNKSTIVVLVLFFALGIGYLVWLDWGCELQGVMTVHGKACFENLK